jgi:hypothetical protein
MKQGMKKGENMVMARMGRTAKVIKEAKVIPEGKRRREGMRKIMEIYMNKSSFMRHLNELKKAGRVLAATLWNR